jgi:hypothetical protein
MFHPGSPLVLALVLAVGAAIPDGTRAQGAPRIPGREPAAPATDGDGLDLRPVERLKAEVALYQQARQIRDPERRKAMIAGLDDRAMHQRLQSMVARQLGRVDMRPTTATNLSRRLKLVSGTIAWLREVQGLPLSAILSRDDMDILRQFERGGRIRPSALDAVIHDLSRVMDDAVSSRSAGASGKRPLQGQASPAVGPAGGRAPPAGASTARGRPYRGLALLAFLGVMLAAGTWRGLQASPQGPPALPAAGSADPRMLDAGPAVPALAAAAVAAGGAGPGLGVLRDAMRAYVAHVHRVKNQLGIASRFDGDPDGLVAHLFDPESFRELATNLERSRVQLAALRARLPGGGASEVAPGDGCAAPSGLPLLLARGERVMAGARDRLQELERTYRSGADPGLAATASEDAGRISREVKAFAADLCALSDSHALDLRDLASGVVCRATYRDAIEVEIADAVPQTVFVQEGSAARQGLTRALADLLDNAHQAGASRIRVTLGFTGPPDGDGAGGTGGTGGAAAAAHGAVTVAVGDDGPGVPAAVRDRLFAPRVTTRPDGTGMGLFGVRRTLQDLGGDAGHDVPESGGCRFWLRFPALGA